MALETYGVGTHYIVLRPKQSVIVDLYGGGGGGSLGVHQDDNWRLEPNGQAGSHSELSIQGGSLLAIARGGGGATLGWWSNGSAWRAGGVGVGGTTATFGEVLILSAGTGLNGNADRNNRSGGMSLASSGSFGRGGNGGNGYGNHDPADGWGAGGGSGGYLKVSYTNNGSNAITLTLVVGKGGNKGAWDHYNRQPPPTDGMAGIAYVDVGDPSDLPLEVKYKDLIATLKVNSSVVDSARQVFSYLVGTPNLDIEIPDDFKGNHINLWDYFKELKGREPNQGEEVTFVIPEGRVFLAPFGYNSALRANDGGNIPGSSLYNYYTYSNTVNQTGHPAVSLKGWKASLNNKITVDVRGKILGSCMVWVGSIFTMYDLRTGNPLNYMEMKHSGLFPNEPFAYYRSVARLTDPKDRPINPVMTEPLKNPAFYTEVPCTLTVRAGGYVLGGSGDTTLSMYKRTTLPSDNMGKDTDVEDDVNLHAGDAIWVGGTGTNLVLNNYGYVSGGGGGGASIGSILEGLIYPDSAYAEGGAGAPYGDVMYSYKFPLWVNTVELAKLPLWVNPYPPLWDFSFVLDTDTGTWAESKYEIEMTKASLTKIIEWSSVGIDSKKDNLLEDISSFFNGAGILPKLLTPESGEEVASSNQISSNAMTVVSGSGGAPGISGQRAYYKKGRPNWNGPTERAGGNKGSAIVNKGASSNVIITNNFPGSTYKA